MSATGNAARRRAAAIINAAIFLGAAAVLAVAANIIALRPGFRLQMDATRTRSYSLSEQTAGMLNDLRGDWTIALIVQDSAVDHALRRQLDEVLKRFAQAAPNLSVTRIDPQQRSAMVEYERLLARLRDTYRRQIDDYDRQLDAGVGSLQEVLLFAQQQLPVLARIPERLKAGNRQRENMQQLVDSLTLQIERAGPVLESVAQARRIDGARPIADYEGAQGILVQAMGESAGQLTELASTLDAMASEPVLDPEVRQFAAQARSEYSAVAQRLGTATDALRQLPRMDLSAIGTQLQEGEAAVIIGPTRATVIPAAQLLPRSNLRQKQDGGVEFDRRFRGEQIIAGAIRSLQVEHMPLVVFVHADESSMLRRREQQIDLLGPASMLAAAGYVVREWQVGTGERPQPQPGQPAVWVIVPSVKSGAEPSVRDVQLMDETRSLIAEGEPVLLSLYPSIMPRFRKTDPWQNVVADLGLKADTAHVICESMRVSEDRSNIDRAQAILELPREHPISKAVDGQLLMLTLPVSLATNADAGANVQVTTLANVEPAENRWRERDWNLDADDLKADDESERFDAPLPIAVAIERPRTTGDSRPGRAVVIGSGGWMLSFVSDVTLDLGGDRVALAHPGNYELLLASVAWLAGMDEFIAPSATSQQVARLSGITPAVRATWLWITLAGMPLAMLGLGIVVWLVRRS